MFKRTLLATILAVATASAASAAPITGAFSLGGFSGSFIGGSQTAATATGLDFGGLFTGTGNGYGTNGSAQVANASGSFNGLTGTTASIADIGIVGNVANPFTSNPFVSFGSNSAIQLNFSNAAVTRSPTNTSITVAGTASYTNGVAADASTGMFSLSVNTQGGEPSSLLFTFTGNASADGATSVPEPVSIALLGAGLVGLGFVRGRSRKAV